MEKKIIFFDVDSTLYSHKTQSIPASTLLGIKKARENGYLIGLATGRSICLTATLPIFDYIKFDYFVTINGTLVLDKDQNIIFSLPCDRSSVKKIVDLTEKRGLNLTFINKDEYYLFKPEDKRCHLGYDPLHIPVPVCKKYGGEDIYQINLFCEDEYVNEFILATKDKLSFSRLDDYGYDIYAKDQTKATGIKHLLELTGIKRENTIAFGDGHNDKEMIEYCNLGIAMGNSVQKVKDASDYVTDDIDNDGIYKALVHFNIIK